MKNPYFIDTVYYQRFTPQTLRIMERGRRMSYISPGEQFNVVDLDEERSRISTLLRNLGYFYFRPDYMTYQADTTLVPGAYQPSPDSCAGIAGCGTASLLRG